MKKFEMFAKKYYSQTVAWNSKEWYRRLVSYLDCEDNEFQSAFGWIKTGIKGAYKHSFFLVEMAYKARLLLGSAKETVYSFLR